MSVIGDLPAYPVSTSNEHVGHQDGPDTWQFTGMSKRELFALAAMQALIGTAASPCMGGLDGYEPYTADAAYRMADAMLASGSRIQPDGQGEPK